MNGGKAFWESSDPQKIQILLAIVRLLCEGIYVGNIGGAPWVWWTPPMSPTSVILGA